MSFERLFLIVAAFLHLGISSTMADDTSDAESTRLATLTARFIKALANGHVAAPSERDLLRWSVEGLFQWGKKQLPEGMAKQLGNVRMDQRDDVVRLLETAYREATRKKKLALDDAIEVCLAAMMARVEAGASPKDRSSYIRPNSAQLARFGGYGVPVDIGLKIERDSATGMLRVVTPLFDGPALHAGIRAGDLITHIRTKVDKKVVSVETKGLAVERAEQLFLGPPGSEITLGVISARIVKK